MAGATRIFLRSLLDGLTNVGPFSQGDADWAPVGVFAPEPSMMAAHPSAAHDRAEIVKSLLRQFGSSYFVKVLDKSGRLIDVEVDQDGRLSAGAFVTAPSAESENEWR